MKKPWKLVIGIESFYLTDKEKEFYLSSISKGAKFVQVNKDLLLGANFQSLQSEEIMKEREHYENDEYKCVYGNWHHNGWNCMCAPKYFDEKTQRYIESPDTKITKI